MADIAVTAVADGTPTATLPVMRNFYRPEVPATSFHEIDGLLVNANRQPGWDVRGNQIRNRSMADGSQVGANTTLDFTKLLFPNLATGSTVAGDYLPVAGCAIEFYLPIVPSILIVTWLIVAANNIGGGGANDQTELRFHFDGARQFGQFRQVPTTTYGGSRRIYRDRVWSGSWATVNPAVATVGWHRAHVGVWLGGGSLVLTRIRNRSMRRLWFR